MIIFSIVGLLLIQFAIFNINKGGVIDFLKNILENSLPTILLIVILYWVVNLNIVYRKKINSNVVPEEYRLFYTSSVILTLFQLLYDIEECKNVIDILKEGNVGDLTIMQMIILCYIRQEQIS